MSAYLDINAVDVSLSNLNLLDSQPSPPPPPTTITTPTSKQTSSTVNKKHIEHIGEDLLSHIFALLTPAELLLVSLVNRRWRRIETNNDGVEWNVHLIKFWSSFSQNVPDSFLLLDRINNNMSLTLIKRALSRIDTTRCVEKIDYQRMLIARLLFNEHGPKRDGKVYYPEWALRIGQHKASFFHAIKDMRRRDINFSELCLIKWRFHFRQSESDVIQVIIYSTVRYKTTMQYTTTITSFINPLHLLVKLLIQDDELRPPTCESKFNEDFSMTSPMHSEPLTWQFVEGNDGRRLMQVEQYPPLTSTRGSNGSWRLDNHFVWFEQVTTLPPDNIPLLDYTSL